MSTVSTRATIEMLQALGGKSSETLQNGTERLKSWLQRGADITKTERNHSNNVLHLLAQRTKTKDGMKLLNVFLQDHRRDCQRLLWMVNDMNQYPIHQAARLPRSKMLSTFVALMSETTEQSVLDVFTHIDRDQLRSPLHHAVAANSPDCASFLLKKHLEITQGADSLSSILLLKDYNNATLLETLLTNISREKNLTAKNALKQVVPTFAQYLKPDYMGHLYSDSRKRRDQLIFLGAQAMIVDGQLRNDYQEVHDNLNWTPLDNLAAGDLADDCRQLLETATSEQRQWYLQHKNSKGSTALHIAAEWGRSDCCEVLADFGASGSDTNQKDMTPVEMALMENKSAPAKFLFNRFPEAFASSAITLAYEPFKYTPIYDLQTNDYYTHIEWLFKALELGMNPSIQTQNESLLCVAVVHWDSKNIARLLTHKPNVNAANYNGCTPLFLAAQRCDLEIVKMLLKEGGDPNLPDNYGNLPLHAVSCTHCSERELFDSRVNVMKTLLTRGAHPDLVATSYVTESEMDSPICHYDKYDKLLAQQAHNFIRTHRSSILYARKKSPSTTPSPSQTHSPGPPSSSQSLPPANQISQAEQQLMSQIKKIRGLRKRLAKIRLTITKQMEGKTLDPEQMKQVEALPEVERDLEAAEAELALMEEKAKSQDSQPPPRRPSISDATKLSSTPSSNVKDDLRVDHVSVVHFVDISQPSSSSLPPKELRVHNLPSDEPDHVTPVDADMIIEKKPFHSSNFAVIYKCKWGSQDYVVKMRRPFGDEEKDRQNARMMAREIDIMYQFSHANIIQFSKVYQDENGRLCIVMPFCKNGSLHDLVEKAKMRNERLQLKEVVSILRGIASAMEYLSICSSGGRIVHRDLNPKNVLLSDSMEPLVSDFGTARYFDRSTRMTTTGTVPYLAPESPDRKQNEKMDVYSFAMIIYELLCLHPPYDGRSDNDVRCTMAKENVVFDMYSNGESKKAPKVEMYRPVLDFDCFDTSKRDGSNIVVRELVQIMRECWQHNPSERPSFDSLLKRLKDLLAQHRDRPCMLGPEDRHKQINAIGHYLAETKNITEEVLEAFQNIQSWHGVPQRFEGSLRKLSQSHVPYEGFQGPVELLKALYNVTKHAKNYPSIAPTDNELTTIIDRNYGGQFLEDAYDVAQRWRIKISSVFNV